MLFHFRTATAKQHQRQRVLPFVLLFVLLCVQASSGFVLRQPQELQHGPLWWISPHYHTVPFRGHGRSRQQVHQQQLTPRLTRTSAVVVQAALVVPPVVAKGVFCLCFSVANVLLEAILSSVFVIPANQTWVNKIDLPQISRPQTSPLDKVLFDPRIMFIHASAGCAFGIVLHQAITLATSMNPWYASIRVRVWILYMTLNLLWAPVLFGSRRLRLADGIRFVKMQIHILVVYSFMQTSLLAGLLLIPNTSCQLEAMGWNAELCRRNPTVNGTNEAMRQAALCKKNKREMDLSI